MHKRSTRIILCTFGPHETPQMPNEFVTELWSFLQSWHFVNFFQVSQFCLRILDFVPLPKAHKHEKSQHKKYSNQHLKMRMNITCIIGSVFVCGDQVCEKQIIGWLRVRCSVGWANGQYKFLLFSFQLTTSPHSHIPTHPLTLRLRCKRTTI